MTAKKRINTFLPVMLMPLFVILFPLDQVKGADFFAKPELGGGTCTRPDPCYFVTALGSAHDGDTVYFRKGTYVDHILFPQVLYLTKSIILLGGWDGSPSGPLVRDPEMHPSILDGENLRRGIYINGNVTPISPTIDGFTITNGNASNLATNCSALNTKGCGGGIFVFRAGARILNNKILNNKAHTIANQSGSGGGLHLEEASGAVIRGNLIQGNQANPIGGDGGGGGLSIYGVTQDPPNVNKNRFINNSATVGGGIVSSNQTHSVIQDNFFENNSASQAAGLAVFTDSTIAKNRFQNHQGQETAYLALFQGTFEGNIIVSNNTNTGLRLLYGSPPFPRLSNNIIAGSGTNAILAGGALQSPLFAELEHNTLVGVGGGAAISIPANNYVTLSLTNNIISGFPVGVENNAYPNSTVTARYTLFDPDVTNHGVNVNFINSLVGDPAFKNPAADDYHIRITSAARDAGASAVIATKDIDGDPRVIGSAPDIGADEYLPDGYLYLPLINK